jgi:uncharacterized radical SAM superfamily Fe-S cluster-containing enzyme
MVYEEDGKVLLKDQCTWEEEAKVYSVIFEDGNFYNQTTLTKIREINNNKRVMKVTLFIFVYEHSVKKSTIKLGL